MSELLFNFVWSLFLMFHIVGYMVLGFIILFLLYILCPPFERLFDKMVKGEL